MASDLDRLVGFTYELRSDGVPVGTERVLAYCRAVAVLDDPDPGALYWAGRATLVAHREDLEAYDRAFSRHFAGIEPPTVPVERHRLTFEAPGEGKEQDREGIGPDADDEADDDEESAGRASRLEVLREKDFADQTPDERAAVERLIVRLGLHVPRRTSRRTRPAGRGREPDLARTLRRSLRTHGEQIERVWRARRTRPRRLVLLFDVSGSMEPYTRPLARFGHAAVHSGALVEAFTFGTRLTRITPALRSRDPAGAFSSLGPLVRDWHGGTRIGESIGELIEGWRRGPLRGAIVVICSDGLDRGDPDELNRRMERLSLLAHRIVWVNPLKGDPRYEPLARGMAAALPHVDHFLPGHNLASLESLARVLREASSR